MIIDSSRVNFSSQHQLRKQETHQESLQIIRRSTVPDNIEEPHSSRSIEKTKEVELSTEVGAVDSLKADIVKRLFKSATGREMKLFSAKDLDAKAGHDKLDIETPPVSRAPEVGLIYRKVDSLHESEQSSFFAEGIIKTRDGTRIDFSVSLSMSREFSQESSLEIRTGAAAVEKIDPLVINFSGNAAELGETHFIFDLDNDGNTEQLATLKSNSAFLALDKNNDGEINNGSELFGPSTGKGFEELAAFDDDNNGFIDEADAVYEKLRLWQQHSDGSQQLLALGDKDIGAIYLGHVSTPFQLTNQQNQSLGEVNSSGVYLHENGTVGTVQQIDYKV